MSKALITGAAGFLGSQLAARLRAEGQTVVAIDNMSSGTEQRLRPFAGDEGFTFVAYDAADAGLLALPELVGVTDIYHLASPASPRFYQALPFETIEVNTTGTRTLLELARRTGAKLVYTSTSEAYGDPLEHPQNEEYRGNVTTWGPRACYDEAKRLGEVYCYEYGQRFGVAVKVARLFNTYSAALRNDDGRVISNFVGQALAGDDLTVYGDGSQTRSFCYVDDTVRGLRLMMENPAANGQIINIGNPVEHTILELAHTVIRLSGSTSGIRFMPLPQDDPKVRRPDIAKAQSLLGWKPDIALEEGLMRTIEVYRGRREGGGP
ncbi:NAD-dependent epimerase/dehydratase family protein [Paenibacillus hodogayensis]|uniref:NAD-dependent epimerase/dehydratase family protein n=1 Tax=Paenibacillus hodogayensis TaxID=279208 RepID=A0ABV5VSW6_9BACL